MNKFKDRLKELRIDRKLDQVKLSSLLNVSQQAISHWEKGDNEPDYNMLIKIAKFFEVSTDYLLGLSEY